MRSCPQSASWLLVHVLTCGALVLACSACGSDRKSGTESPLQRHPRPTIAAPVLVIGVDGFEWRVALPLIHEGRMPHLQALIERGLAGSLSPLEPTLSPRLWATIATGKLPEDHGIEDFFKPSKEEGDAVFAYRSLDRRVKAFWNILGEWGLSSTTLGWWTTFPAEEVDGVMVANWSHEVAKLEFDRAAADGDHAGLVYPPRLEPHVREILARIEADLPRIVEAIFGLNRDSMRGPWQQRWIQSDWAFRADAGCVAVLEDLRKSDVKTDVTAVYLCGTDVVGHRFWAAHDPESLGLNPDAPEVLVFGQVVNQYYCETDRLLGRILAGFPAETTILLVSDHGMSPIQLRPGVRIGERQIAQYTGHHKRREPGIFVAAGSAIAAPHEGVPVLERSAEEIPVLGSVVDFCPTLLALLGVPYGEDMAGRPLGSVISAERLASAPPASIPTHDDEAWLQSRGAGSDVAADSERIEQLHNLGYLGGGG
jgi:hypothetical protein